MEKENQKAEEQTEKGEKAVSATVLKVLGIALNVFLISVLLINVYILVARKFFGKPNPAVFGIASAVVLTDSMNGERENSFAAGDMIFTVKCKEYFEDDVVMFEVDSSKGGKTTITHRIIGRDENGFITKGDGPTNNTPDDTRITNDDIVGKVFLIIPNVGVALSWLSSPLGMMVLVMICFAVIGIPILFRNEEQEEPKAEAVTDGDKKED